MDVATLLVAVAAAAQLGCLAARDLCDLVAAAAAGLNNNYHDGRWQPKRLSR